MPRVSHTGTAGGLGTGADRVRDTWFLLASAPTMWVLDPRAVDHVGNPFWRRMTGSGGYLARPAPSGLADVIEIILDKGIVIDVYLRVSVVGIELLTIDARVVIASVDTYLRFAEATNRLELETKQGEGVPALVSEAAAPVVENIAARVAQDKIEPIARPLRRTHQAVQTGAENIKNLAEKVMGDKDDQPEE